MKKLSSRLLLIVLFSVLFVRAHAQTEIATAKAYLTQNAVKQRLSNADINDMSVSSAYLSPTTGWYHIYFNQNYQSVEVYNGLLNLTLQNGEVKYVANTFVPFLADILPNASLNRSVTPVNALIKAAQFKNLTSSKEAQIQTISAVTLPDGSISKASYRDNILSDEPISVKLYWLPYETLENGKVSLKVALTWNVNFLTKDGNNKWNVHVDANSGAVLKEFDDIIHCNFGTPEHNKVPHICIDKKVPTSTNSKALLGNTYNVFDYPLEAPTFGARTVVTSPYTKFVLAGTGPGTTNGWHNDGTTDFTNTRGNNVWAKEDLAADNETTIGASPSSATLDFNFPYTQATGTAAANLNAAITNMYYWNNVMHDVLWKFGFDEPGGNFQKSNLARGGLGNDFVFADAQDGSGTNNANFSTPADGGNPRMQMFIFSNAGTPAYQPDSDFDNGVIAHEYGHGWSIRLTGGPAVVNCLQNAEQAGEGWSDYIALMTITNWSALTPTVASANIPRGIGTYVLGQPTTGAGIRPFPYSYDKTTVNPLVTYAGVGNTGVFSQPHGIGSIWATMLWDMTWEIILQDNQIVNDIYNVPAALADYKGNVAALKLVNEGLRLQPCSPSFVQARDAILQADQMLFGGRYRCAISRAFTRRGLGALASTGVSSNDRIVTEDYTPISGPSLNSATSATVCSGDVFNYTATTAAAGTFTFAWTRPVVAGISNGAGSASSANVSETLINTTTAPVTVKYFFTISPDACGGTPVPQAVNVVVNPKVTPTVGTYNVCQNATVPVGDGLVVPGATTNTVNGALVSGTTYFRGQGNNVTVYTASASAVFFKTFTFVAPSSGAVTFATTAATFIPTDGDDTYLTLYQTSFTPATPAVNFLRGDDDSGPGFLSSLTHTLTAGSTYVLVVGSFSTGQTGSFTLQASTSGGGTNSWFTAASGGSSIFTGDIFNPVGVAGSGIANTATAGAFNFYVSNSAFPTCRTLTTFNIVSTTAPIVGTITQPSCVNPTGSVVLSGLPTTGTWTINPGGITGSGASTTITGLAAGTTYNFTVSSATCVSATSANVVINAVPSPPTGILVGSNSPVVEGSPINLTSSSTGGTSQSWAGPSAFTSAAQNPVIASATAGMAGVYTVTITSPGTCTATGTTNVVVNAAPTVCSPPTGATAGSNSPVLVGSPINLTSSSTGGTSQVWAGPSGFASTAQNPTIASATAGMAGVYTVTITSSGTCTATATTNVVVNPVPTSCTTPTATASSNSPICAGTPLNLTATCTGSISATLSGASEVPPNASTATGSVTGTFDPVTNLLSVNIIFTGLSAAAVAGHIHNAVAGVNGPVIIPFAGFPNVVSGTYSNSYTLTAPQATALASGGLYVNVHSSSFPEGEIRGQIALSNCTFAWTGVNGFSSTDQNPTIPSATTAATGTYQVIVTNAGCTAMATTSAIVNAVPTGATASSNSPVLVGGTINLTSSSTGGTSQVWGGPSGFTSTAQNPTIASATAGMAGVYTVTITGSGTCIATATTNVVVNPVPTSCSPPTGATASSNSPVLVGGTINLTSSSTGGTSQVWAGPSGFASTAQNPTIASATAGMAGVYTVTITSSGTCTATATTSVVVNPLPTNTVVFVNIANAAAPTQNGTSWATAFGNLQTALAAGPVNAEIWVAQGIYKPTMTIDKTISFNIPSGAMLFGGFVGTEVTQNQRNFNTNPTILSGEIGSVSTVSDNSYHVVTFIGVSNTTILDGFTVMAGNANLSSDRTRPLPPPAGLPLSINDGGGIGLDNASSPMIMNCKIISNDGIFGGGLYATNGSNPTIMNCIFSNNQATFGGGAYHLGSNPMYKNVLISGNKATGGAMYNNQSNPMISNVTIAGNGGSNGAIFNSTSTPVVKNCIIFGNITPFNDTQSVVTYSIIEGGYPGVGNLNLNPQFVNMTPSGLAPTLAGDNRVINTSPAIDAGDNGTISLTDKDLVGNLRRFNGGIVDMGAYEFQGSRVGGTIISITSGNWETNSTWDIGRKPLAGDMVIINNNHIVTVNQDGVLKNIEIRQNAKVTYSIAGVKLQTGF